MIISTPFRVARALGRRRFLLLVSSAWSVIGLLAPDFEDQELLRRQAVMLRRKLVSRLAHLGLELFRR